MNKFLARGNWGLLLFGLLLVGVVDSSIAGSSNKVVYGVDNRVDMADASLLYKNLASSVAAMIPNDKLQNSKDFGLTYELNGDADNDGKDDFLGMLCDGERFKEQITVASCTGFLVAPDLLVTAGHCMQDKSNCDDNKWVFDFNNQNVTVNDKGENVFFVKSKDVYSCKEIVAQKMESPPIFLDYAVVRLERKVEDRTPLSFRKVGKIADAEGVMVIGHPSGLPLKIADGAYVRKNSEEHYFSTNTDTFQGNSGSPVINIKTGEVEGILVRGENDYDYDEEKSCMKVKVCEDGNCRGEDVTRITSVAEIK